MQEISFLGFSKSEWDLINSFANWASAIGSFAAVLVSLHLANRIARPSAIVKLYHALVLGAGSEEPYPEYVILSIVNSGERNFRVTHLGWRIGFFWKREAIQMFEADISSSLPVDLCHGQEARWLVPTSSTERKWAEHFAQEFVMKNQSGWLASAGAFVSLLSLRAVFVTSLGNEFFARPQRDLLKLLFVECREAAGRSPKE